ncbi:uncharacterized protein LOC132205826 [Neocloeon triangulifer]|uniref:uncharacterized protein LOC132205826 n=1 Tax=Neocloeon triangulifer TaxID=2078957 RepID=UPI00286F364A|nr:uncharacterized protein LOC132205826 [Neocloeon triangulifer]
MLAAALLAGLLAAALVRPHSVDHPHIPWLAVQLAAKSSAVAEAKADECRSASATFLLLLLQAKSNRETAHKLMSEFEKGSEKCGTRLSVSSDESRWPRLLVHVQCSCEGRQCHLFGGSSCTTVLGTVDVLRLASNNIMLPTQEVAPVGCVCLDRPSKKATFVKPHQVDNNLN